VAPAHVLRSVPIQDSVLNVSTTQATAGRNRTCVIPIARHSSSQSSFKVPFALSWYSDGIAFSICLGICTCLYSYSLSEYLEVNKHWLVEGTPGR
jgi:hypothetical protein